MHYSTEYRQVNDGRFATARDLVPKCLDLCPVATIRRFFRRCWRYMDAYRFVFPILFFKKKAKFQYIIGKA